MTKEQLKQRLELNSAMTQIAAVICGKMPARLNGRWLNLCAIAAVIRNGRRLHSVLYYRRSGAG